MTRQRIRHDSTCQRNGDAAFVRPHDARPARLVAARVAITFTGRAASRGSLPAAVLVLISVLIIVLTTAAHRSCAAFESQPVPTVVATVDAVPITDVEVQRELARTVPDNHLSPDAVSSLRSAALRQLIDRRLVAAYLDQHGFAARPAEVEREIQRIRAHLAQRQQTLDEYLQRSGLTDDQLRTGVAWQFSWSRFTERYLTAENLARFFEQHRRDFDGAEMSVAHILFHIEPPGDARAIATAVSAAEKLRARLSASELTFAEAAARYSSAPTAADGGRLGFIDRHQPMPEAFTVAAFALEPGEVSPPVITAAGVHLIQCLEIKPGPKRWQDVREDLQSAVARHLFHWAADRQRPNARIELTSP